MTPILLAQAAASKPGWLLTWGWMLLMVPIWWFVLFRPQREQERKHRAMLDALAAGDKVITTGGLLGTVVGVGERTVKVKIADNVKVEVLRSAISSRQTDDAGKAKEA
jgi:preprotein translocase subunit YajC